MFTKDDVGDRVVNGRVVALSDSEKQAIAGEWNANAQITAEDISATRYEHEIAGTTFVHSDGNNYGVATDRQSQAMVSGARLSLEDDSTLTLQWKTAQGFVTLDGADIKALAQALRSHVQACFDREKALLDKVTDGTISEDDLTQGWP